MTNGKVELSPYSYARAADVMSTHSANGFEWSVKLVGSEYFFVGIATELEPGSLIYHSDPNSILYDSDEDSPSITIGNHATIYENLPQQKTGDVIHFKFQPQTKKFVIELVRLYFFSTPQLGS